MIDSDAVEEETVIATAVVVLSIGEAVAVAAFIRALSLHPLPAFARQSARRWAMRTLGVPRWRQYWEQHGWRVRVGARATLLGAVLLVAFAPTWEIGFGPVRL